jgi:hypothetical protein
MNKYLGSGAIEKGNSLNEKKLVYIKNERTKENAVKKLPCCC